MKVFLTGHHSFENRGCEAIVRSSVEMIRARIPGATFAVPSLDSSRDAAQWPQHRDLGVSFVPAYFPSSYRYWRVAQRLRHSLISGAGWPFRFPESYEREMSTSDFVLAVGGDNYSLDYDLPSLFVATDALAMRLRKPVVLWGASVGPFEQRPDYLPFIKWHLGRFSGIFVRESASLNYLSKKLGLNNVLEVADPAFNLKPEMSELVQRVLSDMRPGWIGVNLSPLIARHVGSQPQLLALASMVVRRISAETGRDVLLVPHVFQFEGDSRSSDRTFLNAVASECKGICRVIEGNPNAAELKAIISHAAIFAGSRTHATIAAMSSLVPTVSIAYSVKAVGINRSVFGHERYVVNSAGLTADRLVSSMLNLLDNAAAVRAEIEGRIESVRAASLLAAERLVAVVRGA